MKLQLKAEGVTYFIFINKGLQEQSADTELALFRKLQTPEVFNGTIEDLKKTLWAGVLEGVNLHRSFTHIILF